MELVIKDITIMTDKQHDHMTKVFGHAFPFSLDEIETYKTVAEFKKQVVNELNNPEVYKNIMEMLRRKRNGENLI